MSIKIITTAEGVEFQAFGAISGTEIMQTRLKIYNSKQTLEQYKYLIFNNSQCTEYNITANDITTIADLDIRASRKNPNIIMATIESEYLMFSLTDAWHAHIEDHITKIKSFSDRNSALIWIDEQ